jgi:hypothetical protein
MAGPEGTDWVAQMKMNAEEKAKYAVALGAALTELGVRRPTIQHVLRNIKPRMLENLTDQRGSLSSLRQGVLNNFSAVMPVELLGDSSLFADFEVILDRKLSNQ